MSMFMNNMLQTIIFTSSIGGGILLAIAMLPTYIIIPNVPIIISHNFHIHHEHIHTFTRYICSTDECTVVNTYFDNFTWIQLFLYIILHFMVALILPTTIKLFADNVCSYITRLVCGIIQTFNQMIISSSNTINTTIPGSYELVEYQDDVEPNDYPGYISSPTFYPFHMSGRLPPVRLRPNQFGNLISNQNPNTNAIVNQNPQIIQTHILRRMVNRFIEPFVENNTQEYIPSGIPTCVDPLRIQTSVKLFAGDSCPICINKLYILELINETLAVTHPCNHIFCHTCIDKHVNEHSFAKPPCPMCREVVEQIYLSK